MDQFFELDVRIVGQQYDALFDFRIMVRTTNDDHRLIVKYYKRLPEMAQKF